MRAASTVVAGTRHPEVSMIHPDTVLEHIHPDIGYGVVATRFIPQGTLLWVLDRFDRTYRPAQVARMSALHQKILDKYAYVDHRGDLVLCWDHGRYMNHSCRPTTRSVSESFEIAIRDVHPGEHITCEYAVLGLTESMACRCGEPQCRGEILPDDWSRHWRTWRAETADAVRRIPHVTQALWPLVRELPHEARAIAAMEAGDPRVLYVGPDVTPEERQALQG